MDDLHVWCKMSCRRGAVLLSQREKRWKHQKIWQVLEMLDDLKCWQQRHLRIDNVIAYCFEHARELFHRHPDRCCRSRPPRLTIECLQPVSPTTSLKPVSPSLNVQPVLPSLCREPISPFPALQPASSTPCLQPVTSIPCLQPVLASPYLQPVPSPFSPQPILSAT